MHNTQRNQVLTNDAAAPIVLEKSLLDAMVEEAALAPQAAAPSALDALVAEPVGKWSRGRKLVVRDVQIKRQDSDTQCQGGLFGAVEEGASLEPVRNLHGTQIPLGAMEVERGKGCCVCGDGRCTIGPFIITKSKGGR